MTKFVIQAMAMGFMLCDHMWATVVSGQPWLNWIGRLAFPIFAFLLVEGYVNTRNFNGYVKRMFLFAVLSEIPLNLITSGGFIYPFHQNVLWTFLISLFVMRAIDKILALQGKPDAGPTTTAMEMVGKVMMCTAVGVIGYIISFLTFVDYYGYGLLMVLVFFFSLKFKAWYTKVTAKSNMEELMVQSDRADRDPYFSYKGTYAGQPMPMGTMIPMFVTMAIQAIGLYWINFEMVGGEVRIFELFGNVFEIPVQGLAIFALPLIWMYNGKLGYHSKGWKWFCYAFYPVHMLVLGLIVYFNASIIIFN